MSKTAYSPKSSRVRAVFRTEAGRVLGAVFAVWLSLSAGLARAAPHPQTATPTPTETLPGLPNPPNDGGVVAVQNLPVYAGPGYQFQALGELPYGAFIYPQARSEDGQWMRIENQGLEGWVYRPLVNMGFDPIRLPVSHALVTPDSTPATAVTPSPAAGPAASPTPQPSPPAPLHATETPALGSLAVSATPAPAATAREAPLPESPGALAGFSLSRVLIVAAALLGAVLSARYLLAARPRAAYRGEFVLTHCPACQKGRLTLEDRGHLRRVVRCGNCRSVLRQLRSGLWRYAVDPLPDADFAERYNGQALDEEELAELGRRRNPQRRIKRQ